MMVNEKRLIQIQHKGGITGFVLDELGYISGKGLVGKCFTNGFKFININILTMTILNYYER